MILSPGRVAALLVECAKAHPCGTAYVSAAELAVLCESHERLRALARGLPDPGPLPVVWEPPPPAPPPPPVPSPPAPSSFRAVIRSAMSDLGSRTKHCGLCRGIGHNVLTCPRIRPESPVE